MRRWKMVDFAGSNFSSGVMPPPPYILRPVSVLLTSSLFCVGFARVVVIEERTLRVVALDQASAGRVVVRDGQQQRRPFRQRELRLHQALAEGGSRP